MPPRKQWPAGVPSVTTRAASASASATPSLPPPERLPPATRGSPSKRATQAQTPSKARSRQSVGASRGAASTTSSSVATKPAVKPLKGELEEQAVLASNAYGGKAQARTPVELVASAANNSAGALLGKAVAGAIQKTSTSTGAQLPATTTSSHAVSNNASRSGSQRSSRSSARSEKSMAAADALVKSADFIRKTPLPKGSRAASAPSSASGSSSGSSSRSSSFGSPEQPSSAAGRAASAPASVSMPRPAQWLHWLTPIAWLQALLLWFSGLVLATGRVVKLVASATWSFLATGAPVVLALVFLALISRVCHVHYSAPASSVTLADRFAAPFALVPGFPVAAPIADCVSNGDFEQLATRVTVVEDRMAMAPTLPAPHIQREVNFFAPGTGVIINPYLTSPSRGPDGRPRRSFWDRLFRPGKASLSDGTGLDLGVVYTPASLVLYPWEGAGDCWCSPCSNGKAQVGIVLPAPMVPQELVVEHSAQSGLSSAAADATPQDMELWVHIGDESKRARVAASALDNVAILSEEGVPDVGSSHDDLDSLAALDDTWVRIGHFRYEKDGPESQAFEIPVDLAHFGVTVSNLALRTVGSWGTSKNVCIYRLKMHGISADELAGRTS